MGEKEGCAHVMRPSVLLWAAPLRWSRRVEIEHRRGSTDDDSKRHAEPGDAIRAFGREHRPALYHLAPGRISRRNYGSNRRIGVSHPLEDGIISSERRNAS